MRRARAWSADPDGGRGRGRFVLVGSRSRGHRRRPQPDAVVSKSRRSAPAWPVRGDGVVHGLLRHPQQLHVRIGRRRCGRPVIENSVTTPFDGSCSRRDRAGRRPGRAASSRCWRSSRIDPALRGGSDRPDDEDGAGPRGPGTGDGIELGGDGLELDADGRETLQQRVVNLAADPRAFSEHQRVLIANGA